MANNVLFVQQNPGKRSLPLLRAPPHTPRLWCCRGLGRPDHAKGTHAQGLGDHALNGGVLQPSGENVIASEERETAMKTASEQNTPA